MLDASPLIGRLIIDENVWLRQKCTKAPMQADLTRRILCIPCAASAPAVELSACFKQGFYVSYHIGYGHAPTSDQSDESVINIYIKDRWLPRDQRNRFCSMRRRGRPHRSIRPPADRFDANTLRIDVEFTELLLVEVDRPPRATEEIGTRHVRICVMFELEMEAEPVHAFEGAEAERRINFDDAAASATHVGV